MAKYDSYVICTSPRSGSTLLCDLLTATGIAGVPDSYFHRPSVSDWLASFDLTPQSAASKQVILDAIFQAAIARGSGETGIFGLRLQRHSFDFFAQELAILHPGHTSDAQRFRAAFGRTLFVHLTRRDKVEQAISYVKARQTGLWHVASDGTELERLNPHAEPIYDGAELRNCYETMMAYDRDWRGWFERENIDPLRISYDALSADPLEVLCQVLDRLGVDCNAANGIEPGVKKLADSTNQDWATRFRSEFDIA